MQVHCYNGRTALNYVSSRTHKKCRYIKVRYIQITTTLHQAILWNNYLALWHTLPSSPLVLWVCLHLDELDVIGYNLSLRALSWILIQRIKKNNTRFKQTTRTNASNKMTSKGKNIKYFGSTLESSTSFVVCKQLSLQVTLQFSLQLNSTTSD